MKKSCLVAILAVIICVAPFAALASCPNWCEIKGRPVTVEPELPNCVKLDDQGASACGCDAFVWVTNECGIPLQSVGFEWGRCQNPSGELVSCSTELESPNRAGIRMVATDVGETHETFVVKSEIGEHRITLGANVETFDPGWNGCAVTGLGSELPWVWACALALAAWTRRIRILR